MEINMHAVLGIITVIIICFILGDFSIIKYIIIAFVILAVICFFLAWLEVLRE